MRPNSGAIPPQRLSTGNTPFASAAIAGSVPPNNASGKGCTPDAPFESLLEKARGGDSETEPDIGSDPGRTGEAGPGSRSRATQGKHRAAPGRDRLVETRARPEDAALVPGVLDFGPPAPPTALRVSLEGLDASNGADEPCVSMDSQSKPQESCQPEVTTTETSGSDLTREPESADASGGGADAMLQWLEPVAEEDAAGLIEGVDPPLKESVGNPGNGERNRDRDEVGKAKAGIAGWTSDGAANLTPSGIAPIAGPTATGVLLDGTWSAQQEDNVGKNPTDAAAAGLRKAEGALHSYRDSIAHSAFDPVAILGADLPPATPAEIRPAEMTSTSPVRELREGLMEGMLEHSANIRASSSESLDVSIRAGGGTEIAVQFSYVDGVVHAHAQCERGDYQLLSTLWHDLQLNLSKHGISLSTLVPPSSESNPTAGSADSGPGSRRENGASWGRDSRPSREEFLFETSSPANAAGSMNGWLKLQSRRLFETWA